MRATREGIASVLEKKRGKTERGAGLVARRVGQVVASSERKRENVKTP